MKVSEFAEFYRLIRQRTVSEKHYIRFQEFQAERVVRGIAETVGLKGKLMLDLGCGRGGYTKIFQKQGGIVVSLDMEHPPVPKLFRAFVQGDATQLPFKDNTFDFVYSSSLIEHLPVPSKFLKEVCRVIKKGAVFYLSFPPFYTPVGGHQFKPYNMFLPERAATFMARKFNNSRSYKYNDERGKLYIMTIRKARKLAKAAGFTILKTKTRFLKINPSRIPLLNEILTWHVEFYLQK
ncbi:class I SAM-dependent methyltransferase [Candidatus Woesearchaeota archaeon]|nr:class I SAM-dependent methyltransferase [Candidatus Woesearchaeota archaeon]